MNLEDYIVVTDQLVPDAALTEIRSLLTEVTWLPADNDGHIPNHRTCDTVLVGHAVRDPMQPQQRLRSLDATLFGVVAEGARIYRDKFPDFTFQDDSGYELLRYKRGQFYKRHIDHFPARPRSLAFSLGLNNNYKGGRFSLFGSEIKVKAGHAIMFPANFMFPHEIKPVTAGIRYSMITWLL